MILLAIDAGNTRIKWGLHDGAAWLVQGAFGHLEIERLPSLLQAFPTAAIAAVSSVASAEVDAALQLQLDALGIAHRFIRAEASRYGVINSYRDPVQMGSDRWAALVAARQMTEGPAVVVSAGTAMTVDALSSGGEFLGGLIVPGLTMMKTALADNTARVQQTGGVLADFPLSTGDAVHNGALKAMAGAVGQMLAALTRREGRTPALLLTGGDAAALRDALSGGGEIVDNLVLEGLLIIMKDSLK